MYIYRTAYNSRNVNLRFTFIRNRRLSRSMRNCKVTKEQLLHRTVSYSWTDVNKIPQVHWTLSCKNNRKTKMKFHEVQVIWSYNARIRVSFTFFCKALCNLHLSWIIGISIIRQIRLFKFSFRKRAAIRETFANKWRIKFSNGESHRDKSLSSPPSLLQPNFLLRSSRVSVARGSLLAVYFENFVSWHSRWRGGMSNSEMEDSRSSRFSWHDARRE